MNDVNLKGRDAVWLIMLFIVLDIAKQRCYVAIVCWTVGSHTF